MIAESTTAASRTVVTAPPGPLAARLVADAAFGAAAVCSAVILILGQSPGTERLCYALLVLLVVPLSVAGAWRARGESPERLWQYALTTAALTTAAVLLARWLGGGSTSLTLLLGLVAARAIGWTLLARGGDRLPLRRAAEVGLPLLAAALAASFVPAGSGGIGRLALAAVISVGVGLLALRAPSVAAARVGRLRPLIDVVFALVAFLAVLQLSPVELERVFNMAYFLGPANDVLHGQPMLVHTFSQYGVGMIDALAAIFTVLPMGFGVMTLVIGTGSGLIFVCLYAVVRLSLGSQLVAGLAVLSAVVVYIYAGLWQYADYPSTGALRFGPPWLVVLLLVLAASSPSDRVRRRLEIAAVVVVGAAAVWSAEDGMYCVGSAIAIALVDCAALDAPLVVRARAAVRRVAAIVAAVVIALILFSLLTAIFAGSLPDWGPYLSYVHEYTFGGLGLLPIGRWSPGIAVGGLYAASAALVVGLLFVAPSVVRDRSRLFRGITGITVMGALEFSYFLGRAAPTNLIHVSAPAVTLSFLWLGATAASAGRRQVVAALVVGASFVGALIVMGDRVNFGPKFAQSGLGVLVERPSSIGSTLDSLADNPVVDPNSPKLERFITSVAPSDRQLTVVGWASTETETLIRLHRGNAAGSSNPCQESLSSSGASRLLRQIRMLRPGGILVTYMPGPPLLRLQQYELSEIYARFRVRTLARQGDFAAFLLAAQKPSWHGGGSLKQPSSYNPSGESCA